MNLESLNRQTFHAVKRAWEMNGIPSGIRFSDHKLMTNPQVWDTVKLEDDGGNIHQAA
jgi:hypothetical protein